MMNNDKKKEALVLLKEKEIAVSNLFEQAFKNSAQKLNMPKFAEDLLYSLFNELKSIISNFAKLHHRQ